MKHDGDTLVYARLARRQMLVNAAAQWWDIAIPRSTLSRRSPHDPCQAQRHPRPLAQKPRGDCDHLQAGDPMSVFFDPPAFHGARCRGLPVKSAHLMADSTEELLAFAASIGLRAGWLQHRGTPKEHFDLLGVSRIEAAERAGAERLSRAEFVRRWKARRIAP